MNKKLSVIIPTFNGKDKVKNVLASLEKQKYSNFEVIVVIDGSTDGTYKFLKSRQWEFSEINIVKQENRGRSGARNSGAELATGDILVFFDDDVVIYDETILGMYADIFEKAGCSTIVGKLEPLFSDKDSEFEKYCQYLNEKWGHTINSGELKTPYITANNFGIRRSFFNKIGGFDNRLNDAEDFDLAVKIFEAGYPIFFDKQLMVYHQLYGSFQDLIGRQLEYKKANELLLAINPAVKKHRSYLNYSRGKKIFLWSFSFPFFSAGIDNHIFKILPEKLKFKLYDWVLEANILFRVI